MAHKHGAQAGSIGAEVIRFYSLLDTRSMGNCLWNSEGLSGSVSEIIMCKKQLCLLPASSGSSGQCSAEQLILIMSIYFASSLVFQPTQCSLKLQRS